MVGADERVVAATGGVHADDGASGTGQDARPRAAALRINVRINDAMAVIV